MLRALTNSLRRLGATFGIALRVAACGGVGATPPSARVRTVEVATSAEVLFVGTTGVVTARALGADGEAIDDVVVRWRSSAANIVEVSEAGVLSARAVGSVTITGEVGSVSGSVSVRVELLPIASIRIEPSAVTVARGATTQLTVRLSDQLGGVITGRPVTWTSSASGVATVSSGGLVTGVSAGSTTIRAVAESREATAQILVTIAASPSGPQITSIEPALMQPGSAITIRGSNFAVTPGGNEVRVNGVMASVTASSATELIALLPINGFGCAPTQSVFVQVLRGVEGDARAHPLQSARLRALEVGESVLLTDAGASDCFELPAGGGWYALSVYSIAGSAHATTGFRLRGAAGLAVASDPVRVRTEVVPMAATVPRHVPSRAGTALRDALQTAESDAHARVLEANRRIVAQIPLERATDRAAGVRASAIAPQTPVGTIVPMRIPNVGAFLTGGGDFCQNHLTVNARVLYNGTRAIVLEDTSSVFGAITTPVGQSDSLYREIGEQFDAGMFSIVEANFGSPLRLDAQLDNNGKIIMLFSPRVNAFGSLAGFVVSCDFFPTSQYASSNRGEVFYSVVPTNTGASLSPGSRTYWYWTIRSTLIHETKHIASYANRIADFGGTGALEDPWLEEGLARHAEEIWSRQVVYDGLLQGANADYASTLFCDVRPLGQQGGARCLHKPYGMYRHFGSTGLYDFLRDPEPRSPLGGRVGASDFTFYASAWSIIRWALDNHPVSESAFLTSLVRTSAKGIPNVTARLGRSWEEIVGEWSLAMYLDDRPGFVSLNPRLHMPSWNMPSIYHGMATDFPQTYTQTPPLRPRAVGFGTFEVTVPTVGGSAFALFELSGQATGRQMIELLGTTGSPLSPNLRIALVRLQ